MNLLTPARRLAAVQEVHEGIVFSLSLPLDYPGGPGLWETRSPPRLAATRLANGHPAYPFHMSQYARRATDVVCDDEVTLCLQYSTQWDALAHCGSEFDADGDGVREAVFYNGFRAGTDIAGPDDAGGTGARRLGIENLARAGVQGRGVLLDLYREYGRKPASVGYEELMRLMESQQVEVEAGDFLCLYTGFADLVLEMNKVPDHRILHRSCAGLAGAMRACSAGLPTAAWLRCAPTTPPWSPPRCRTAGPSASRCCRCTSCACSSSASTWQSCGTSGTWRSG